jgi:serine phosphatase RsbU (regulator of sigma subunit)/Tfp pilus assembly protein PilF
MEALKICAKLEAGRPKDRLISNTYADIAVYNSIIGNYTPALHYYTKALEIMEASNDRKGASSVLTNMGNVYSLQGMYPNALSNHFRALKIREDLKDQGSIAGSMANIGIVFFYQHEYAKALDYFFKALKIQEALGNKVGISGILANIGNVYIAQISSKNLSAEEKDKMYSNILHYYLRSLKIDEEINNRTGMGKTLGNIGSLYQQQGNFDKALEFYTKALTESKESKDLNGIALNLSSMGSLYMLMKKFNPAEEHLLQALTIDDSIGAKESIMTDNNLLSELYYQKGDYKRALDHYKNAISVRDSLFSEEDKKKSIRSEMNFEFEKKEAVAREAAHAAAAIAAAESKKQKIIIISVITLLLLLVVFFFFLFNRFRLIQKQKIIIEKQKNLVEQKHQEITDSINYAERIQRSLLASDSMLSHNLKDFFIFFHPKDIVSGDFYWAGLLSNGQFVLVTADSTGHGVPGAIMSILNISCLEKAIEAEKLTEPGEILNHTRIKIIETLKKDGSVEGGRDGMDCSLISFDFKNHKLTYSAANNPVWIIRENKIIELKPCKMPVGKHENDHLPFTQQSVDLKEGDVIYTLTDGISDQFGGPKGKKFMNSNLKELLVNIAEMPMSRQKEKIAETLHNWKGTLEQVDDITVIGIKF